MIKRNYFILYVLLIAGSVTMQAHEGFWLPGQIPETTLSDMKKSGMKLSASDLYQINKACLKDAVLSLSQYDGVSDPFATASFVSEKGLVLTNFHCILRYLEHLSTVDNDFIRYGYWAKNQTEESPLFNLQANQLLEMIDITQEMTHQIDTVAPERLDNEINARSARLVRQRTKGAECTAKVFAMTGNSQYIMVVYRVFPDVRMVASPPVAIGKFGGDQDNWMWPRHTGDFAFLRVYADKENKPARYSKDNVPYKPAYALTLSKKGVCENDFAMVYGYPGQTRYYVPSFALDKIVFQDTKAKAEMSAMKRDVLQESMRRSDTLRIHFTPLASSLDNVFLRSTGEIKNVRETHLLEQKTAEEASFQIWAESTPERKKQYGRVLPEMKAVYDQLTTYNLANFYFMETAINGANVIPFAGKFEKLMAMCRRKSHKPEAVKEEMDRLWPLINEFFTQFDRQTDQKLFTTLLTNYVQHLPATFYSKELTHVMESTGGDLAGYLQKAYDVSLLTHRDSLSAFLQQIDEAGISRMEQDPLYRMSLGFYYVQTEQVMRKRGRLQKQNGDLYAQYLRGMLEKSNGENYFPDANRTLRVSYGKVTGCRPDSNEVYRFYTTLDEAVEKGRNHSGNADFQLPPRLLKTYNNRDFGQYALKDTVYTCFLTDAHTTSGNSGSPVLNAKGELIGIVFDRIWQGLSSDYRVDPDRSRSIAVDIRYVLFLLDKYGYSPQLLKELKVK
jgi:hypothetical protein